MKQINLKSDKVAALLEQITERTGETKVDAVTEALEGRLQELNAADRGTRTLEWLRAAVWSHPEAERRAPSKEEQEDLLGF